MKSYARAIVAIGGLVVLAAAASVSAQSSDATVTNVPFAFTVGQTTLPRDAYRISRLEGHMDAFMIRSLRHGMIMISQPDRFTGDETPRLVFHRYGNRYFLREVRMPGRTGYILPKTRAERDAAEHMAERSAPDVVVVASR